MGIYERLMGLAEPKLSVHSFMAAMQEYMLNNMTGTQATAAFGLSTAEQTEALALRDRLLTESSASSNLQRRLKAIELENVLVLAETQTAPYETVAAVKARLGVT